MDARESRELVELLRRVAGLHDVSEALKRLLSFGGCLALELGCHERCRSLRNRTARALEGDSADALTIELQVNGAVVSASRVVARGHAVGGGQLAAIAGALVVIEDDRLVEIAEIAHEGTENS